MKRRVAIIGAGVSGLAAAVELFELSHEYDTDIEVAIYEARREAGGRTRSFVDNETGDTLDNGQHLLMGCYTSTIDYLKAIGSYNKIERSLSLEIPFHFTGGSSLSLSLPKYIPTPVNLLVGIMRSSLLAGFEKSAAIRFGIDILLFAHDKNSHDMTCDSLFVKTKQPETLVKKLWEPIILATMNAPTSKASAQVFINIMRVIFFHDRRYSQILFPKVGLSELLIDPALEYLSKKKCEIKYGAVIGGLTRVNGLAHILGEDGKTIEVYDAAIDAATNFTRSEGFTYSPIVNVYFWVDRKILDAPINGFIGTSLQWCFPKPSRFAKQLIACTVSAGEELVHKTNDEITDILWKDILQTIPSAKYATLVHSKIIKEKRATVLLTPDNQKLRPNRTSEEKNIYFAGDLAQNSLPMTIEGAVRNGQICARKVLESLSPQAI
ncbi:MAG TPA: hydroxysqualene dehydroxylase HpnE [Candidatus Kapabacteria bacterium]